MGHGRSETLETDPFDAVRTYHKRFRCAPVAGLPRFTGGLVGYFGYETMGYIEPRLKTDKPDPIGAPDILLMVSEDVLVFDNLSGKLLLVTHANPAEADAYGRAMAKLEGLERGPSGNTAMTAAISLARDLPLDATVVVTTYR